MRAMMNFRVSKDQILNRPWFKRLLLRAFLFASTLSLISFLQVANVIKTNGPLAMNFDECPLNIGSKNFTGLLKPFSAFAYPLVVPFLLRWCKESENFTINVFKELMEKDLLNSGEKALCVGEGSASAVWSLRELGIPNALRVDRHPFFSLARKRFFYELEFKDDYFDFVFSRGLDRVSVPAFLVHEIERVLRPGGIGAMLVGAFGINSGSLIRSANPVSSFLRSSDVVHVCGIGPYTLVIFKKRFENAASFEHYDLPDECPSIRNSKPFMKYVEPLMDKRARQHATEVSYLPNFMNISSRNRLTYVSLGAGDYLNLHAAKLYQSYYSKHLHALNFFVVDHNISVLTYVKNPGITFVYYPDLAAGSDTPNLNSDEYIDTFEEYMDTDEYTDTLPSEEEFDFVHWFKETRADGDFVVLMMNGGEVVLKILNELYKSGGICYIDELFLHCSDNTACESAPCRDCKSILRGLRSSGVFVHQWWGD